MATTMLALTIANSAHVPSGDYSTGTSSSQDSFRVVRRLCESTSSASIYLCEELPRDEPESDTPTDHSTDTNHVVLKVGRRGLPTAAASQRSTSAHTSLEPHVSADSIVQEFAVANRLLTDNTPHPHIIQFNSVAMESCQETEYSDDSDADGLVVLIMEYCPGGDLFSLLEMQPDRRFDEAHALSLFTQIVSGVHHLHSLGIAHLDISLENVLLDSHGRAKICDFGLSVFIDDDRRQSAVGAVGKLIYMAPEVARGGAYDPVVADVWSLGIVLFILLTGSPLFQVARPSDAAWSALRKVGIRGILSHWKLEEGLSSRTIALLTSMLRVDPSQRLQCLDEVLEAVPTDLRSV